MAEGRGRSDWYHTSAILAMLANQHRDPKKRGPFQPHEFNPYHLEGKKSLPKTKDLSILKRVFVDQAKFRTTQTGGKSHGGAG